MPRKLRLCIVDVLVAVSICAAAQTRQEITVTNIADKVTLAGELCLPDNSTQPKAVVVMATGSGSQDRDETILGHKPFLAIANALATNGYASLRLDDRGVGESDKGKETATTDNFANDIACAVDKARELVPGVPVGVLGHSEGGTLAVKLASRPKPNIDFIITLGCPAFRGDSIILSQTRIMLENSGQAAMWEELYPSMRRRYDILMAKSPRALAEAALYAEVTQASPEAALPQMHDRVMAEIKAMCSSWYREFLRYDPTKDISAVSLPWLAINGERDTQVSPDNLEQIAKLNPSAQTILLPRHNHLMLECITGLPQEYQTLQGDISDATLQAIISFLDTLTAP